MSVTVNCKNPITATQKKSENQAINQPWVDSLTIKCFLVKMARPQNNIIYLRIVFSKVLINDENYFVIEVCIKWFSVIMQIRLDIV